MNSCTKVALALSLTCVACLTETDVMVCHAWTTAKADDTLRIFRYADNGRAEIVCRGIFADGKASTADTLCGKAEIRVATLRGQKIFYIAEDGDVRLNFDTQTATGSPLNDAKNRFDAQTEAIRRKAEADYDKASHDKTTDHDERTATLLSISRRAQTQSIEAMHNVWKEHADDALGAYAFWRVMVCGQAMPTEVYLSEMDKASDCVRDFAPTRHATMRHQNAQRSAVGCQMPNIAAETLDGQHTQTVNYLNGKGLTIVHIFDPQNGKTPFDLNILRQLSNTPKISICEFADADIAQRICQKFDIDWPMLNDPNGTATHELGLFALPSIFVVGADGIVAERNIEANALTHWLEAEKNNQ